MSVSKEELAEALEEASAENARLYRELKVLEARLDFIKSSRVRSNPKMDGQHHWLFGGNPWPPLRGPTFEEAMDSAIAQVEEVKKKAAPIRDAVAGKKVSQDG